MRSYKPQAKLTGTLACGDGLVKASPLVVMAADKRQRGALPECDRATDVASFAMQIVDLNRKLLDDYNNSVIAVKNFYWMRGPGAEKFDFHYRHHAQYLRRR
jgi:hypothetical protein